MRFPPSRSPGSRSGSLTLLIMLICWGGALWPRLRDLSATMALADSVGPFLAAARPGWRPHAPPYGWGLYPPYVAVMWMSSSLWQAFEILAWIQAGAAPLAALAVRLLRPRAWGAALAAGLLVGLDRGLLDTTLSGAEGYLAPTWLALMTVGIAGGRRAWGPWVAATAWALAVLSHPFALATAPLLLLLPRRRASLFALALAAVMLAPRVIAAFDAPLPVAVGDPWVAPDAWLRQGQLGAIALLGCGLVGLSSRRTRGLALATALSAVLLFGLGLWLGYLRDHHLRLLTGPLAVGLAALPRAWGLLALALLRPPSSWAEPPGHPQRSGTLGRASQITDRLAALGQPVVVDGAWLSGSLVAEPAAVMLDLQLRGLPLGGDQVAVIVSTTAMEIYGLELPGALLDRGDHYALVLLPADELPSWQPELCARGARLGGAADALALDRTLPVPVWGPCLD